MDTGTPTDPPAEDDMCPAAPLLVLLRGRWTASLIHYSGTHETTRFGALQRALSVSPKVLTTRLRALERHGHAFALTSSVTAASSVRRERERAGVTAGRGSCVG